MNLFEKIGFFLNLTAMLHSFYLDSLKEGEEKKQVASYIFNKLKEKREIPFSDVERMVSDLDPDFIEKWIGIIERRLIIPQFEDVVIEGKENLVQKENEVLCFASSHRSLYDIPLLGITLNKNGINAPVYTAGSNLARGPLKYGLKKFGAALLDREKLRSREVSEIILANEYFTFLNINQKNTVVFPEATRSRTTAFDKINCMFLRPVFSAQEKRKDVEYKIIFVTESYDRVPEDIELVKTKEASGKKKSLIKDLKDISRLHEWCGDNFGSVYISFSKPLKVLDLTKGIKKYSEIKNELENIVEEEFKKNYKITNYMLAAYALSESEKRGGAMSIYSQTGKELEKKGFNVYIKSKDSFLWSLEDKFGKRIEKNKDLRDYYSAFVYSVLNNEK